MVDFSQYMRKPAGQATKPAALFPADYPAVVASFEKPAENKNGNVFIRFQFRLTGWGNAVPEDEKFVKDKDGKPTDTPIDPTKRQMRRDFFMTEDALYRLDEFIRACGVNPEGQSYEETIPQCVGANVSVGVEQYVNQKSNEIGNNIGNVSAIG